MTTKIEVIYENVLAELEVHGFEDSTENRLAALEGLRDAWNEDTDPNPEKLQWELALTTEIMQLKFKLLFPQEAGNQQRTSMET